MSSKIEHYNLHSPQPGEIWQVSRTMHHPSMLAPNKQCLYAEPALKFLQGFSRSRYVMIVAGPERSAELQEWQTVLVMVLSLETEFVSDVDLLVPSDLSQVAHNLLAETWHMQRMLVRNLSGRIGCRLSRRVYELLLATGDFYHGQAATPPKREDLQSAHLQPGERSAQTDLAIQAFHHQESAWSDVLTVPLAVCQAYRNGIRVAEHLLQDAIARLREFTLNPLHLNPSHKSTNHPTSPHSTQKLGQRPQMLALSPASPIDLPKPAPPPYSAPATGQNSPTPYTNSPNYSPSSQSAHSV
jgi:hypothetical protein